MLNLLARLTKNPLFATIQALLTFIDFSELFDKDNRKEFVKLIKEDFSSLKLFFRDKLQAGKIQLNYQNVVLFMETVKLTLLTFKSLENFNQFVKEFSQKKEDEEEDEDDEDIQEALNTLEAL